MVEAARGANRQRIESLGNLVAGFLPRPVDVRVKADNGTNLKFRLAGPDRKAYAHDGVISDEDLAAGTSVSRSGQLPTGEVCVAAVQNSAKGTFPADGAVPSLGRGVQGVGWTFHNGKVTE